MALTFDFTDINDYEDLVYYEKEDGSYIKPETEALIFATMTVGIREITEDNWKEFFARLNTYENAAGTFLRDADNKPVPISAKMVRDHVGLKTNASTHTRTQFFKHVIASVMDDIAKRAEGEANREANTEISEST